MFEKDTIEAVKNYAQAVQSVATVIAIIFGGIWAYFRFIRQREHSLKVEFTIDAEFIGFQDKKWLVEIIANVENKGAVLHKISDFYFLLRYVKTADELDDGEENINFQTNIEHFRKKGYFIPQNWEYSFIEPGIKNEYKYVTTLPIEATFVLIHGKFKYQSDEHEFHTAIKLKKVPSLEKSNTQSTIKCAE